MGPSVLQAGVGELVPVTGVSTLALPRVDELDIDFLFCICRKHKVTAGSVVLPSTLGTQLTFACGMALLLHAALGVLLTTPFSLIPWRP